LQQYQRTTRFVAVLRRNIQTDKWNGGYVGQSNLSTHGVGIDKTTGTIYAVTTAGDIYKQTNGTGAFVALGEF
jgi:hypothetical protein